MKQSINKLIKSYEPLMHKLLHRFKVKRDYEDNMQELRIVVWKALTKNKERKRGYDKTYINTKGKSAKPFTYIYKAMKNQLQTILKIKYRITPYYKDTDDLEVKDKIAYYVENPSYYEDLPINEQLVIIIDAYSAKAIKAKIDFKLFYSLLTFNEKQLLDLSGQGLKQEVIAKKLKWSQTKVNYKLKSLRNSFKNYICIGGK